MGDSHANQNECSYCGREGESKYDFTATDLLFLELTWPICPVSCQRHLVIIFRYQIYMF